MWKFEAGSTHFSTWRAARQARQSVYNFWEASPLPWNLGKQKLSKIWRDFGQLHTLIANITGTDEAENGVINYNFSHAWETKLLNFCPLHSELTLLMLTNRNSIFFFIAKNATAHKVNSYCTVAISYCTFCVRKHYFRPCIVSFSRLEFEARAWQTAEGHVRARRVMRLIKTAASLL